MSNSCISLCKGDEYGPAGPYFLNVPFLGTVQYVRRVSHSIALVFPIVHPGHVRVVSAETAVLTRGMTITMCQRNKGSQIPQYGDVVVLPCRVCSKHASLWTVRLRGGKSTNRKGVSNPSGDFGENPGSRLADRRIQLKAMRGKEERDRCFLKLREFILQARARSETQEVWY